MKIDEVEFRMDSGYNKSYYDLEWDDPLVGLQVGSEVVLDLRLYRVSHIVYGDYNIRGRVIQYWLEKI